MGKKFFKRYQGRASYKLFPNYSHYLPGVGGMFGLLGLFLLGALLGNLLVMAMSAFSAEFASTYGTVISYPIMFIPAMLFASAKSRMNDLFEKGYALDNCHFGKLGGFRIALISAAATLALAFIADSFNSIMPPVPEWFEMAMEQIMNAPIWITLISVSVFAPLFEEWLCRGLVLRGLLQKTKPGTAIVVSAVFFAVLHMNPWQALPAFLLGLLFGYVYYRTGSLKLTMLMHCVNNTMATVFSKIPSLADADSFKDVMSPWAYVFIMIACIAFTASTFVVLRNIPISNEDGRCNCDEIPPMNI